MILEYFGEQEAAKQCEGPCCDVCASQTDLSDAKEETVLILNAVGDLPGYGEVKVRFKCLFKCLCVDV